ncbi:hypothetical protein Bca4012_089474 [Brassica carinata]
MDEVKRQRGNGTTEADFVLQWGERKRVRCMKVKKDQSRKSADFLSNRKLISRAVSSGSGSPSRQLNRPNNNGRRSFVASPDKEDRYYTTRGCKLLQRPKKRAKLVQKTLLMVSPGTWLSDLCKERYEVRRILQRKGI